MPFQLYADYLALRAFSARLTQLQWDGAVKKKRYNFTAQSVCAPGCFLSRTLLLQRYIS